MKTNSIASLVLGGYVNGYSIVRELHGCGVKNIWLFDYGNSLARKSNKLSGFLNIEKNSRSLRTEIENLKRKYEYIVIFPTDDLQLELLNEIYSDICDFCFLPFNPENLIENLDKNIQYRFCENLGVPYPKTLRLENVEDIELIKSIQFPVLIKPSKRHDLTSNVFRGLFLEDKNSFTNNYDLLKKHLLSGVNFIVSEFIPGDDTNIYAYTGYRSKCGEILNGWVGKKLTQYPNLFGVFSSASNEAPAIVREQGEKLLNGMNLMGIAEPEFKFDSRDGKYKLMEINLRSMMWHRVGNLSGVKLQYTQWCDAVEQPINQQPQNLESIIHFVYMKHEILNLISRKKYLKHFLYNIFGRNNRNFAVFDKNDLKPFLYDLSGYPRALVSACLKRFFKR